MHIYRIHVLCPKMFLNVVYAFSHHQSSLTLTHVHKQTYAHTRAYAKTHSVCICVCVLCPKMFLNVVDAFSHTPPEPHEGTCVCVYMCMCVCVYVCVCVCV
jgi:hypothetical protein